MLPLDYTEDVVKTNVFELIVDNKPAGNRHLVLTNLNLRLYSQERSPVRPPPVHAVI